MNDCFVGAGVPELFAGQALHGFGVIAQDVNLVGQIEGDLLLILDFAIHFQDFPAHTLVFLNQRTVTHEDEQQNGNDDQADDQLGQFAPNAEINVHCGSKSRAGGG